MIKNLRNVLANIYYERLPKGVLRIIGPLVEPAYSVVHRLYSIASDIYPQVTLFKENGSHDSPNLTLFIAGKGDVCPFLLDRIYNAEPKATKQSRRFIWRVPSIDRSQVNAVIIEADRCFSRFLSSRRFVAIPEWVLFTMDVSMPANEIFRRWKKRAGKNFTKIRKYKYVYEVSRDREKLYFFYHKMYLPYIKARFGRLALLASFGYMENLMQSGELLLVKREAEYVSGGLFISKANQIPMLMLLGVTDGRSDYVKQGAISALYYYIILRAKERGYTKLDFGHCRPFLNDGGFPL